MEHQPFGWRDAGLAALVVAVAAAARVGYLLICLQDMAEPPPFQVQDAETAITSLPGPGAPLALTERDRLVRNICDSNWFGSPAFFADNDETTAHVSPGYPFLVGYAARWIGDAAATRQAILWTQCGLGILTALAFFLFARLAFNSTLVGVLAGILTGIHPFWVVNIAELQDGTLTCFLLAACLFLGTVVDRSGNPLASFVFGAALAALALVRAALLPFGIVACLWLLLRCRRLPRGWLCALLVVLGFGNGLAPWTVRNYQVFGQVIPIVDSMFVHLWIGSNDKANGGPQDEETLRRSLPEERVQALREQANQALRYRMLAGDLYKRVRNERADVVRDRLRAFCGFVFGTDWIEDSRLARETERQDTPGYVVETVRVGLPAMLLVCIAFGLLGWRWSFAKNQTNLAALAAVFVPLPYLLSHAERLAGPRLPLDGVFLCYAAYALAWMLTAGRFAWNSSRATTGA